MGGALFVVVGVGGSYVVFDGGALVVVVDVGVSLTAFIGGVSSSSEVLSSLPLTLMILFKALSSLGFKPPYNPPSTVLTLSLEMESTSITCSPCIVLVFEALSLGQDVVEEMFAAAAACNPSMCTL